MQCGLGREPPPRPALSCNPLSCDSPARPALSCNPLSRHFPARPALSCNPWGHQPPCPWALATPVRVQALLPAPAAANPCLDPPLTSHSSCPSQPHLPETPKVQASEAARLCYSQGSRSQKLRTAASLSPFFQATSLPEPFRGQPPETQRAPCRKHQDLRLEALFLHACVWQMTVHALIVYNSRSCNQDTGGGIGWGRQLGRL